MKVAKIRNNVHGGPWLNWLYIVDVYEVNGTHEKLVSRTYTNESLTVGEVTNALADSYKVEV